MFNVWYEKLPYKDFDKMVIEEIQKAWNWTYNKAQNYYHNELEKRSCFDYGVTGEGIDENGQIYSSTRLAILRILKTKGIVISDLI